MGKQPIHFFFFFDNFEISKLLIARLISQVFIFHFECDFMWVLKWVFWVKAFSHIKQLIFTFTWILVTWISRAWFEPKPLPHLSHFWGLSFSWTCSICIFNAFLLENILLHWLHFKALTFSCTIEICWSIIDFWEKHLSQEEHLWGLCLSWTPLMCTFRFVFVENDFLHILQENFFISSCILAVWWSRSLLVMWFLSHSKHLCSLNFSWTWALCFFKLLFLEKLDLQTGIRSPLSRLGTLQYIGVKCYQII